MSTKKKTKGGNPGWTPFREIHVELNEVLRDQAPEIFDREQELYRSGAIRVFTNALYTVHVYAFQDNDKNGPIHISIKRNDRKASRDWRHFQRIKNELVGPDRVAYEAYPAEESTVDTANQYHLWVVPVGVFLPYGYTTGEISEPTDIEKEAGVEQRPIEVEEVETVDDAPTA